mmetsp:Transcript_14307/g.40699  ORF Transcript_14307/g.40699 Transcript_14307/m.40699 type:complete len:161 (-) Transcript_14307:53-535(-)
MDASASGINNISLNGNRDGNAGSAPMNAAGGGTTTQRVATTGTPSATLTITASNSPAPEVIPLSLAARPSVRWDADVVDNEGMGRKSSKRCCIFHKQREFGESSTDSSDVDSDDDHDDEDDNTNGAANNNRRPAARRKKGAKHNSDGGKKKVPDFQRFHA